MPHLRRTPARVYPCSRLLRLPESAWRPLSRALLHAMQDSLPECLSARPERTLRFVPQRRERLRFGLLLRILRGPSAGADTPLEIRRHEAAGSPSGGIFVASAASG